jgi:exopolyphosphatase/guanosine-5'-triphosphate,3'-diphosphate pyrophosphatase
LRKVEAPLAGRDFPWQLLCLRLAVIACHARSDAAAVHWRLQRQADAAKLGFDRGTATPDPRTLYLLKEELAAWQKVGSGMLALEQPVPA